MSDSDDFVSFSESGESQDVSEHSESDETVVSSLVDPYQDEPLAHLNDEEENDEVLVRARFQGQTALEEL